MINSIEVEIPNQAMQRFIENRTGPMGMYATPAEYVRDLIRRDFESEEQRHWRALYAELLPGLNAPDEEFVEIDIEELIKEARLEYAQEL